MFAGTNGIVTALEFATGCAGAVIYHPQLPPAGRSVPAATRAVFSPALDAVALARKTGDSGPVRFSSGSSLRSPVWEIVLVDPRTGVERILVRDAISEVAPLIAWNDSGSHLLLRWPVFGGL